MGVTRLLLLGPFYYIQTNFSILFCTRLYCAPETKACHIHDTCNHFNWPINISGYKGAWTTDAWWLNPNSYPNSFKMSQKLLKVQLEIAKIPHNLYIPLAKINQLHNWDMYFCKKACITCPLSLWRCIPRNATDL